VKNIFDRYYIKYDQWYEDHKAVFQSEVAAVKKALRREGRGLEVGVGTGRFAQALEIGQGIDPSEKMLQIARQRGIETECGFGERLPYENGRFDFVLVVTTICFLDSPAQTLREIRRVLKKRGRIVIGFIEQNSFLGKLYKKRKSGLYVKARFLTVDRLTRMLAEAGYRQFTYYQTIFQNPENIKVAEKPKQGYGQGSFVVIGAEKV